MREVVRQAVAKELLPMLRGQIAQAKGLRYLVTRDKATGKFIRVGPATAKNAKEETIEVWEKDPSTQAWDSLTNRAMGKPAEQLREMQVSADAELLKRLDLLDAGRARNARRKE